MSGVVPTGHLHRILGPLADRGISPIDQGSRALYPWELFNSLPSRALAGVLQHAPIKILPGRMLIRGKSLPPSLETRSGVPSVNIFYLPYVSIDFGPVRNG